MPTFFGMSAQAGVPNVPRTMPIVRSMQDGVVPFFEIPYELTGITYDVNGAVLGGCTVSIYRTADDSYVSSTTSDATTGYYSIPASNQFAHYLRAYKAGSPDVNCSSVNTLLGT